MDSSTPKSKPMTKEEAMRLVELVAADGVITSRATNATNNKLKEEGWRKLTESFNSSVSIFPRCAQQLRLKWENLKKSAQKRAANMRSSRFKTGGGKDYFPPDEVLDKVASLLGTTCEGLPTNFGGDVLCEIPVVPSSANMQEQAVEEEEVEEERAMVAEENIIIQVPPVTKNKFPLHRASGNKQALKKKQEMESLRIEAKIKRDVAVAEYLTVKKRKIDAEMEEKELLVAKLKVELQNAHMENERLKKLLNLPVE